MKHLILSAIALLTVNYASASAMPDEMYTVIKCHEQFIRMDAGMNVQILKGGFAGLTQLRVTHFFLGRNSTQTYIVKEVPQHQSRIGSGVLFTSATASLAINFTTTPLQDGGHAGELVIRQPNDGLERIKLSCQILNRKF